MLSLRSDEEIGPLSPLGVSLAAGFSGSVAAAASHCFDTAKSRSQCVVLPKVCLLLLTRFVYFLDYSINFLILFSNHLLDTVKNGFVHLPQQCANWLNFSFPITFFSLSSTMQYRWVILVCANGWSGNALIPFVVCVYEWLHLFTMVPCVTILHSCPMVCSSRKI